MEKFNNDYSEIDFDIVEKDLRDVAIIQNKNFEDILKDCGIKTNSIAKMTLEDFDILCKNLGTIAAYIPLMAGSKGNRSI